MRSITSPSGIFKVHKGTECLQMVVVKVRVARGVAHAGEAMAVESRYDATRRLSIRSDLSHSRTHITLVIYPLMRSRIEVHLQW